MMTLPSISIIVPVYNVENVIDRCIQSISKQTYQGDLECIFVDDCSPDNSACIIENFISTYKGNIHFSLIHHQANKGLSGARNSGIKVAKGDYLYFLDSDDALTDICIESLAQKVQEYPNVDIVQGNIVTDYTQHTWLELSRYHFPAYSNNKQWIYKNLFGRIPVTVWNKLIKTNFILKNNLFFKEGIVHEDEHWRLIAYKYIRSICFCKVPTYVYYDNECSITNNSMRDKSFISLLKIIEEFLSKKSEVYPRNVYAIFYNFIYNGQHQLHLLADREQYLTLQEKVVDIFYYNKFIPLNIKFLLLLFRKMPNLDIPLWVRRCVLHL